MGAPSTGILDNFNRTNEGPPPSSNWTQTADAGESMRTLSNEMSTISGGGSAVYGVYWSAATFGADSEVYATIPALGASGSSHGLEIRLQSPGSANRDGYFVEWANNGDVGIYRVDNASFTLLGSVNTGHTKSAGNKIGFVINGSTLQVWKDTGSGWTQIGTDRTDSTYSGTGNIGVLGWRDGSTALGFDDFGGGTISAGGASILRQMMQHEGA